MHRDLKAAREEAQAQEQSFQRELSSAQKLSDMYKEMANARIHKCESLEGVLRELKTHLEVWPRLCNGGTSGAEVVDSGMWVCGCERAHAAMPCDASWLTCCC